MSTGRVDPDELALLEEQRDHLLSSLEDLEREHEAGDLDDSDYRDLRDDYTVRASQVIQAIAERRTLVDSSRKPSSRGRTALAVGGVLVLAVLAGVMVARNAGQRGGGAITGAVNTPRARLATCQQVSFQKPEDGVDCYAEILADAPDNVEALTYQGWAFIRLDRLDEGARNLSRAVEIDPDYPDARVFRAVLAARAGDYRLAASEVDRFYRNNPSPIAVQVLQSQGLEREIFVATIDPATRDCWQQAARGQDPEAADPEAFLVALGSCLESLLADDPGNVDAMVSLAYTSVDRETGDLSAAVALADRAVATDPSEPNALLLRASLAFAQGRGQDVDADLVALDGLARPTASFLFGSPSDLRKALDSATSATTAPDSTSTTAARPSLEVPGGSGSSTTIDPRVPNPGGG